MVTRTRKRGTTKRCLPRPSVAFLTEDRIEAKQTVTSLAIMRWVEAPVVKRRLPAAARDRFTFAIWQQDALEVEAILLHKSI